MSEIYVYHVDLPPGIHEMVCPCIDGYTIYLSISDDDEKQRNALRHALYHIKMNDFEKTDIQMIEGQAHEGE